MLKKIITAVASIALALATVTVIEVPTSNAAATRTVQLSAPKGISAGTLADYSLRINWLNVSNNSGYNVKLYNNVDKLITQSGQLAKDSLGFTFGFNAFFLKKNTTYRVTVTTIGGSTVGSVTYKTSPESRRISVKTSLAISINAGNNQSATVGTAVSIAPSVIVKDANNNLVSGVNVTFAVASGGGLIIGESATTDSSGIATVGSWKLGTAAGNNTLSATSGSLTNSPLTFTATATAGSATTIAINAGDSQSAAVGTAVSIAPSVIVKDANNNPVSGVNVTFTVETGGGAIVNTAAQITDGSGIASAGTWTLGTAAGNNTLSATSGSLTNSPLTFTATATAGTAASAVITTQPTGAVSGTVFTGQPVIKIVDSNGNTVTGFTDNVVAAIATGVGTLSGTTTQTAVAGVATFTDLVITGAAGNFTLTFTPSAGTAVTSDSFALTVPVTPAAPSVTADDTTNTITGLDVATMEYSSDGGSTWSQAPAPTFAGNQSVLVRVKAQGVNPASATTPLTFTTNPTYAIGATGPGGGIVFYYNAAGFNCGVGFTSTGSLTGGLCYYLEVAPNGWKGSPGDPLKAWAVTGKENTNITDIANDNSEYNNELGIGLGYKNSALIVTQGNDTTTAAGASRAYSGGGMSDWYLPTTAELNLLCQWNHGVTQNVTAQCTTGTGANTGTGAGSAGLFPNNYWSSSEKTAGSVWAQAFDDGNQNGDAPKSAAQYVRPIRAFSNPAPFASTPTYALSASPTVGSPVTASPTGSWSPSSPTLHYQWKRSDNGTTGWSDVTTNSDSASYTPVSGDVGKYLEVVVTASAAGYTNSVVTSSASAVVAAAAPVCGSDGQRTSGGSGPCQVGDRGPGGGFVFYVDNSVNGFTCGANAVVGGTTPKAVTTCHYLEVAPNEWNSSDTPADERVKTWAVTAKQSTDVGEITNDIKVNYAYDNSNNVMKIGLGLQNSLYIVAQGNDTTTAAGAARAYDGGGMVDWYLPTAAELNLLCQWGRGVTQVVTTRCTGGTLNSATFGAASAGLLPYYYKSSSENSAANAWEQYFGGGFQDANLKSYGSFVRPIRAFGAPSPVTPAAPSVTADDTTNTITGLDVATMEYSSDGGSTWSQAPAPTFAGNQSVLVRVKAQGINPASATTPLSFTTNPIASPASLITNGAFTIQMWIKPTAGFDDTYRHEFFALTLPGGGGRLDIWYQNSNWEMYDNSLGGRTATSGSAPVIGRWYNVVLTRDVSSNLHLFIDGVERLTFFNNRDFTGNTKMWLGVDPGMGPGSGNVLLAHLRIVDGDNLFPNNFTPDATAPTNVTGTTFLLQNVIPQLSTPANSLVLASGGGESTTSSYFEYVTGVDTQLQQWSNGALGTAATSTELPPLSFTSSPTYALSASPTVGSPVTATPTGSWSPSSPTLHYQWKKSDNGTTGWSDVTTNSDSASYTPVSGDLGKYLEVVVTASANGYTNSVVTSSASAVVAAAATAAPVCGSDGQRTSGGSGPCQVGDRGPGGGIVYYYSAPGFLCGPTHTDSCNYLEVAPNGWAGSPDQTDPILRWGNLYVDVQEITDDSVPNNSGSAIGLGYLNSLAIVAQSNDTTTAAGAARAYGGGFKSDWYLPDTAELNLLCQWDKGVTQDVTTACTGGSPNSSTYGASAAGFVVGVQGPSGYYWSSSERDAGYAWLQYFEGSDLTFTPKDAAYYVRPIRAFGTPSFTSSPTYALSASPTAGSPVTATPTGSWSPSSPTLHYQWKRSDNGTTGWSNVTTNSDSASYTPVSGDVGKYLEVVVTASAAGYANSVVTSSASAVVAAAATTQTYAIGATGPGGGIVFYYNAAGFACGATLVSTCHYLEVAPSGWNTGADPDKAWAASTYQGTDVSGITNDSSAYNNALGIGLGLQNSLFIVDQNGAYNASSNNYAAGAARAYTTTVSSVNYNDWYLPTTAELNLLCQWNHNVTQNVTTQCGGGTINSGTGATESGFIPTNYWSSSEYDAGKAWYQHFGDGGQNNYFKSASLFVRPVRAF